ncbi:phycobilisome linker polypeptide [Vacuolonema iberomarrocanum]|uniref:phycobilisome linker polypeptide n=1 Tax=Vacuolonema iberomarrocanum TaxID=3454632 RepID=UPI001A01A174|nr:hypothetical protein [filamentous cyanobacterium LEGE 07170]
MAVNRDDARILLVEVMGLRWQGGSSNSPYTFKVPYCSLARTLQFIKRKGGKIVRVELVASSLPPFQRTEQSDATRVEASEHHPIAFHEERLDQPSPSEIGPETNDMTQPSESSEKGVELSSMSGFFMRLVEKVKSLCGKTSNG